MFIKLNADQIPKLWDVIKYAAVHADSIKEEDRPMYLNRLLQALLSDKAQCFVNIDTERKVLGVGITRLIGDEITGEKTLFINCLYSFKGTPISTWKEGLELATQFAAKAGCKKITAYSNNERVFEIVEALGFSERYRCFIKEV